MALKFSSIQALGRALMLPIAMLPVAGLLLRFGQPDLLNIQAIADAGNAIFANLPLLFAIGVAVGFAKDNNGASGLAGAVGYLILVAMLKSINKDIDSGVLGGILIGSIAGVLYNKYKDIKLPEFLAFFGGKRFIPIATGISAVILGIAMGYVWPPIQNGLHSFSQWMAESGEVGMFIYGLFNRLLLVTGLHHVLNSLFWFQLGDFTNAQGVVVHGDIARFMAGDPTAGFFQAGFFPIMMFGLPAICLAMYTTAHSQNKKMVAGLLLSMALTSFLTGVTEPIEYSFVFLAPVLYVIHAVLTGISLAVMELLHVRLGFSFSAGAIDYVLFFKLAQNPLLMLPVGAVMFVLYYSLGVFFIKKFNLPTIGRESEEEIAAAKVALISNDSVEMQYINALGGADNLINVDACTTRLRLVVRSSENINKPILKALGAKGFVTPAPDSVQVILGPQAEIIASKIRDTLNQLGRNLTIQSAEKTPLAVTKVAPASINVSAATEILSALGGKSNLKSINLVALTRAKIELKDEKTIDLAKLKAQGVIEVINLNSKTKQLYIGVAAENIVAGINQLMK
ncbi:MAG TPA: PTS N-acetyl-D-glucosamine transporter [Neisseriales bacterium]|jgi:PTS system N-acetylglucosamine-specific IIC component|nr:PTS transporter subunit EIIC [Burkholderiales bacterium]HCY39040.1 PTS N-acetyl-D-glucosamine transporter [Neisseriales bacterium]